MLDVILFLIAALLIAYLAYILITATPEDRKAYLLIMGFLILVYIGIEKQIIPTDKLPKVISIQEQVRGL